MSYRNLLVVTYGRSGSTLLQGLLNSIDGFLIRGENYGLCQGLFLSFECLCRAKSTQSGAEACGDPTTPFFGAAELDKDRFLADARHLLMHQLVPEGEEYRCVGFKEIRHLSFEREPGDPVSDKRLREYLWFLVRVFANPAIVVLTRDHDQVVRSGWWRKRDPNRLRAHLTAFEETTKRFSKNYPHTFTIDYADLVSKGSRLKELFEFLGADYDLPRIAEVLDREHSFGSRTKAIRASGKAQQRSKTESSRPNPK
jgi:hypothetical protein